MLPHCHTSSKSIVNKWRLMLWQQRKVWQQTAKNLKNQVNFSSFSWILLQSFVSL
jgi:hypothetical protein